MATTTRPMTADEFLTLPDDGTRQELIRGEVRTMPLSGERHGDVALEMGTRLRVHMKANGLGRTYAAETGFLIQRNPDTVRGVDVAFVRAEKLGRITDRDR